ncbi:MAG: hypothetical protein ACTH93_05240 [Pseudoclavibacter sp.]
MHDTLPSLDAGRHVLSTVRLIDSDTGQDHSCYEQLHDWHQLLHAEHCDVLMDEIVGIAGARESQGMPVQIANLLVQLRRRDVVLRWTAPAWARADKIIRETTQAVTVCRGSMAKMPEIDPDVPEGEQRLWKQRRLFKWRTFDAANYESFTQGTLDRVGSINVSWFWGPHSRAFASYDTLDAVAQIGHVMDSGRCAICGGRRRVQECTCDDYVAERDKGRRR